MGNGLLDIQIMRDDEDEIGDWDVQNEADNFRDTEGHHRKRIPRETMFRELWKF